MIEFVHQSDYSSGHHCQVHERETNQKPRVASDFCNHATNKLSSFSTLKTYNRAKNRLGPLSTPTNWVLDTGFSGKVHYCSPEKVIADKVFCDFNSVADIQFGNA